MSLTPEQLELRKTGIGGSEIAAVVGLSPYARPIDVFRAKREGRLLEETLPMKRGRILEPAIATWYAEDTGAELREVGTLRHPSVPVALATPDRIARKNGEEYVLEIKTAGFRLAEQWGEPGTDEVPQAYLCQVAWEMACADMHRADLAVLIAGDDFRIYHLLRDRELEGMLLEAATKFWRDHVVTGTPPPPDGSDSWAEWIETRYPEQTGPLLQAGFEEEDLAEQLFAARAAADEAEAREKHARQLLEERIGSADGIGGDGWRITWRRTKGRTVIDWEALARELNPPEDLIHRHTRITNGSRRFLPTKLKPKKEKK